MRQIASAGNNPDIIILVCIVDNGNVISSGYIFAGDTTSGFRTNANDYGNTIYQNAATISAAGAYIGFTNFTLRDNNLFVYNNFRFNSYSSGG